MKKEQKKVTQKSGYSIRRDARGRFVTNDHAKIQPSREKLAQSLAEARKEVLEKGGHYLTLEEITQEVARRRGEIE